MFLPIFPSVRDEFMNCQTAEELLAIFFSVCCALDGCSDEDQALLRPHVVRARGKYLKHVQMHGCEAGEGRGGVWLPLSITSCRGWIRVSVAS
jgi:hypothetical protein